MTAKKKTPPRKKKARKKNKHIVLSQTTRLLLAGGFLLAFVVLSLLLLVSLRDRLLPEQTLVYEERPDQIRVDKSYTYGDVFALLENQLINGPQSQGWRKMPERDGVDVRRIFGDFPSELFLDEIATQIVQTNSPGKLDVDREQGLIRLSWAGRPRLELRYSIPEKRQSIRGKVAIIMDDMGGSLTQLKNLLAIDLPVTPAILPGTRLATSSASLLSESGREYMIHIPMQPRSYPRTNPGADALLIGQSESEVRRRVRSYQQAVPGAVGGNNHMGSRYTEEPELMRIVLDELKRHNQFFIDSRTIGSSVAFTEARKMGLKTATRNIFLDNREDVAYVREQLRKMVRLAGSNREIVAICHPHKETLEALRLELEWLKQQPVDFVPASTVVHVY